MACTRQGAEVWPSLLVGGQSLRRALQVKPSVGPTFGCAAGLSGCDVVTPELKFVLALLLGSSALLNAWFPREGALKRKFFPWHIFFSGACFLGFAAALDVRFLPIAAPAIALITLGNIWQARYCNACDRGHLPSRHFTPTACERCGGPLYRTSGKKAQ